MDAPADRSTRTAGPQIRRAVREAGGAAAGRRGAAAAAPSRDRPARVPGADARSVRFDVLPGGCVISRIRAVPSSQAEVMGAGPNILGYVTREQLSQALDQRSGGRLHL